ncbi:Methyltransferase domain-containing protein [Lasiodiplodia theobromae]|uniref:Methyltransferase domain-containing protein n=1 Tax=Lasiodiplodia theobromae TaxID=45133 RepID=UPI0015C2F500|nr:Methyltransferase domain-containing protein [Lasiodiplodia theobromae]KAF4534981.1 Methyltransferase domain-containing protein [Lasiodiplodia theobromae]
MRSPDDDQDADSALGVADDADSAFTSSASRATEWRFENGRRYHAYDDGSEHSTNTSPADTHRAFPYSLSSPPAYNLPNDALEQSRLDLQHVMWLMTSHNTLYLSPLHRSSSLHSVLDVGCGTGAWTIAFADAHPDAHVIGTDLSPVQPAFVPPNCEFLVDNAERDWAFGGRKFDFIHARMLCMGIHDWPRFLRQCWENLAPGGWLELREITFPWRSVDGGERQEEESPLLKWSEDVRRGAARAGIDTTACRSFETHLNALGFVNLRKEQPAWPLGTWPRGQMEKRLGKAALENLESGLQAISTAVFSRYLGMSRESIELSIMEAQRDMRNPTKHYYAPLYLYSCQKPVDSESRPQHS